MAFQKEFRFGIRPSGAVLNLND